MFVDCRLCTRIYVNDDVSTVVFFFARFEDDFCAIFRVMACTCCLVFPSDKITDGKKRGEEILRISS